MTLKELNQYRCICEELAQLKIELKSANEHVTVTGSDNEYPYIMHVMSVDGAEHTHRNDLILIKTRSLLIVNDVKRFKTEINQYCWNEKTGEPIKQFDDVMDALLAVKNMLVDDQTAEEMRDKNILQLYDNGEASWLVKQVNDAYVENIKNRIEKDIYMSTSTVNMSDENFANNASGIAIQYKLICMENRIACTERFFMKGLQRRFELICNMLNLKGGNFDYTDIKITFSRNLPRAVQQWATTIQQLQGIVSKETLLAQLPFVDNPKEEILRAEDESGYGVNLFQNGMNDE